MHEEDVVLFERQDEAIPLPDFADADRNSIFEDVTLYMSLNYEDPSDLYFEGGIEFSDNHRYVYKEFASLDDMLKAFEHPEKIEFHR